MTGLLDQAAAAFEAGRLPQAEMLCQTRLGQSPNDRAALRQLGFVRLANGDSAGALVLLSPLLDTASNDQELLIALGEAAWAVNSAAAAIPYFQRVLSEAPGRVLLRMRVALAQYTAGQSAAACDSFRLVLAAQPENAVALAHFGMASLAAGQAVEAVPALQRATDMLRDDATCACQLGLALRELGRFDEALDALREAVRRGPEEAALRLALGDALFARRDFPAALAELRLAVRLDPAAPLAWAKLGDVENLAGDKKQAVVCYRRAADLQPDDADLQALLGNALFDPESPAAGQAELGRSMSLRWRRPVPPERRMRVGILAAPGFANTPTGGLVDRARFAAAPIFMLDPFHYPCSDIGRSYDVLFNAVSDPDAAPAALAAAERLVPQLGLPVINPPAMIASTARDAIATRLLGIDGLQIPLTRRYARAELHDPQAAFSAFDAAVLVRAAGRHGGQSLVRAESAQAVQAAAAALPPGDVYLTQFVELRSPDGLYRKLRLVFVDGAVFPVHLAIGDHWLGHYFRTRMAAEAALRAEEAAFLAQPACYLGPRVWAALAAVPARIGLGFFGMDAAIGPNGDLVLFECNAAMLVRHAEHPLFNYKRVATERIRAAMSELLAQTAISVTDCNDGREQASLPPPIASSRASAAPAQPRC